MPKSNKISSDPLLQSNNINTHSDVVLILESATNPTPLNQNPGVGSALSFFVPLSSTNKNTSGSIITKSTNTDSSLETFDMDFKLCHKKNGEDFSTLDTRLILSPGKENHNNENKLILVNPYESDANEERKSTLQFRGFKNESLIKARDGQVTPTITAVPNVHNGTAQGGGNSTITLDAGASGVNNTYNNNYIEITDGTGNGQIVKITEYNGGTKVATIEGTWNTNPDNTSVFKITSTNPNYVVALAANSSSNNDYYNTFKITIKDGDCKGQTAIINDYDGTTKVATLNKSWINNITPDVGDPYELQTFSNMGEIEVFHTGTGADDKGMMRFNVNDGGDTPDNLHTIMELRPKTSYHSGIAQAGTIVHNGTAQAGAATTITLDAGASGTDNIYNNNYIQITSGTGNGQIARITGYDGTTKIATIEGSWTTNPDNTSVFRITPINPSNTITLDTNASAVDDFFNSYYISIISGTGNGQSIKIIDYDGTTKVATIDGTWTTNPDNTSEFEIFDASVTIYGDLNINRTITSTNTTYKDTLIKLGQELFETPSKDIGIIFTRGNGTSTNQANKGLIWDESLDAFTLVASNNENGQTSGNVSIDGYEKLQIHKLHLISNSATDSNGDGTTLSNQFISSDNNDLTIQSGRDLNLNVTGGDIFLKSGSDIFGSLTKETNSNNLVIKSNNTTSATFDSANVTFSGNNTINGVLLIQDDTTNSRNLTITANNLDDNRSLTITPLGGDRSIVLNESFTIGDGNDGTITFSNNNKTLTIEDNSIINQDVRSDANVTFSSVNTSSIISPLDSNIEIIPDGNGNLILGDSDNTAINLNTKTEVKAQFATNVNGAVSVFSSANNAPSVANGNFWKTHESNYTIIDFSNGIVGQTIYVLTNQNSNVTYDCTKTDAPVSKLKGGTENLVTATGDLTVWTYDGTYWYLVQFMDKTSNNSQDILNDIKEVSFSTETKSLYLGNGTTPPATQGVNSLRNTSIGVGALTSIENSNTGTQCDDNSTFGYNAGNDITTGYSNTCVGSGAGATITTGYNNTCIGEGADIDDVGGFNRISIGHGAICEENNEITLGSNIQRIRCNTSVIATVSDERDKKNIEDCEYGEDFLNKIRPRKFTWDKRILNNNDKNFSKNGKEELGFIAQELLESMNENNKDLINLVSETNPERLEIMSGNLLPIMVKAIQEMSKKIKDLETKLNIK